MTRLAFAPLIPMPLLTALAVIALLITAYALFMRARGAWARGLAFAVLLLRFGGPASGAREACAPARCGGDRHRPLAKHVAGQARAPRPKPRASKSKSFWLPSPA